MNHLLYFIYLTTFITATFAVICPGIERMFNNPTGCYNSAFYACERTVGIRRACDHQLRQPMTWRRGISVFESCQRNQPLQRYTAIATFQGPDYYPFNGVVRNAALFLECGPDDSITIMDQRNANRTYAVWQRSFLDDRGSELTEYNSRLYYKIEGGRTRDYK